MQIINLALLNRLKERQRVANEKPAKLRDLSMSNNFVRDQQQSGAPSTGTSQNENGDVEIGSGSASAPVVTDVDARAFADLTDKENDEFQYVL